MRSAWATGLLLATVGCGGEASEGGADSCGPAQGVIARVIDGDTAELTDGARLRYLLVDTPELGTAPECYGPEAKRQNEALVLGKEVRLEFDLECQDRFGRLLAYLYVGDRMINEVLVQRGYARVIVIPPNERYEPEIREAERSARSNQAGLWGACQ
ncbi:MAG: thermonuclease family protein [Myxococcota bacterium]